jgi:outer membrane lipoprotein SlyB
MTKGNRFGPVLVLMGALTLGACANTGAPPYATSTDGDIREARRDDRRDVRHVSYGVVQAVERVRQDPGTGGSSIGLGTIAGAVVGGVVGNQVGSGRGNTAATVIGAAGGAYIGHELENRQPREADALNITLRMEDGSHESLMVGAGADFRVGDRVRIRDGVMERY